MRRNPINLILTGIAVADLLMMLEYIPFAAHMYLLKYQGSRWIIIAFAIVLVLLAHVLLGLRLDHICICNYYICACTSSNARAVGGSALFSSYFYPRLHPIQVPGGGILSGVGPFHAFPQQLLHSYPHRLHLVHTPGIWYLCCLILLNLL